MQGHAIGAGAQLALACDLRVLADDAQLRLPEASLGLVPDLTGTSTLMELVGYSRALEICLTGRAVTAAEAQAIGLANVVVPAADLDGTVADLAAALIARAGGGQPRDGGAGALRRPQRRRGAGRRRAGRPGASGCRNSSEGADTLTRNRPGPQRCWPVDGKEAVWTWAIR